MSGHYESTMINLNEANAILALVPAASEPTNTTTTTINNNNNNTHKLTQEPLIKPSSGVDNNEWGATLDPASGRVFYHHPLHGSQWEKPKDWVDQTTTIGTTTTTANTSTSASTVDSVSNVNTSMSLPDGWSSAVDPASGRTFYYRTGDVPCHT